MSKRPPLFKVLDTFLFKQVDRYETSQAHQKVADLMAPLSETGQKLVNHSATIGLILLPIVITLTMVISNYGLSNENAQLSNTLDLIEDIKAEKREVGAMSSQIISNGILAQESDLLARLRRLNTKGNKVTVISFDKTEAGSLGKAIAGIKFNDMTMQEFKDMLETLQMRERVKINRLSVDRNGKTKKLAGELEISHFSKEAPTPAGEDS